MACCRRQPGYLVPGDFERVAAALAEAPAFALRWFWASPGAVVALGAERFRIPTVTPRMESGRCVFLTAEDRCAIHGVAPFGCAHFSACGTMPPREERRRSRWGLLAIANSAEYAALRAQLPPADSWRPADYRGTNG